jgi:hypothetical protein
MKAGGKRFGQASRQEEIPVSGGESVANEPQKVETTVKPSVAPPAPGKRAAPPDWLKPKIFKSTNIS